MSNQNRPGVSPILLLTCCATSGGSLSLSELLFSYLSEGWAGLGCLRLRQAWTFQTCVPFTVCGSRGFRTVELLPCYCRFLNY